MKEEELINDMQQKYNVTYKSKIQCGSYTIFQEKHFNKLQKIMWKFLLGIKIEDVNVKM